MLTCTCAFKLNLIPKIQQPNIIRSKSNVLNQVRNYITSQLAYCLLASILLTRTGLDAGITGHRKAAPKLGPGVSKTRLHDFSSIKKWVPMTAALLGQRAE